MFFIMCGSPPTGTLTLSFANSSTSYCSVASSTSTRAPTRAATCSKHFLFQNLNRIPLHLTQTTFSATTKLSSHGTTESKKSANDSLFSSMDFCRAPFLSPDNSTYSPHKYLTLIKLQPSMRKLYLTVCNFSTSATLPIKHFCSHFPLSPSTLI
ncbi:hypothetical protein PHAVU_007G195400 [Phaseolus vulgaris]|uniref:Uncharacterized protein n=1 Tax=Phaseolus vulgaris TaxID=3885 RepID=V7BGG8_PHAVU|nr:hypothetical protein PHAVU_007G195400g [Phaseolus vulgaris]ESW16922.1 hypothetical protein PHAVU_007G195400g [Phaseolus vulgaris]